MMIASQNPPPLHTHTHLFSKHVKSAPHTGLETGWLEQRAHCTWALISRERPLTAVPGRCDAVAVGLIDRKHVGVVGANRDAAAAKGDREYLHPIHTSAPLKAPGFPSRYVCLWCAEQLLSLSLSLFKKNKKKKHPFETKGHPMDAVANRVVPLGIFILCLI